MILDYDNLCIPTSDASTSYKESIRARINYQRDICMKALRAADRQCMVAKEASLEVIRLEEMLKSVERKDGELHS
jgi:hypothetical protein